MVKKSILATDFGKKPYSRPIIREVNTETTSIIAQSFQVKESTSNPPQKGTEEYEEVDANTINWFN